MFANKKLPNKYFLKGLHIIPPILTAMFSHNTSGYDMLFLLMF